MCTRTLPTVCSALCCPLQILKDIKHSIIHAGFNNIARLGLLIPFFYFVTANITVYRQSHIVTLKIIKAFKITAVLLIILIFVSPFAPLQNASALASVVQITSAKSSDGSDIPNGGSVKIPQGQSNVKITFEYRGFDDNDHVLELRCSWDGVNYLKSNCSSESVESRTTFQGPDGVTRTYYVKTGTASRQLQAPPVPRTYTFGVKVLNDNNNLSPAATWKFRMGASTNPPVGEGKQDNPVSELNTIANIKVHFDSIKIHSDHDGYGITPSTCCSGEWNLWAFVNGKKIKLPGLGDADGGEIHNFPQNTQVTLTMRGKFLPLSIFTNGFEDDSGWLNSCTTHGIIIVPVPTPCGFCVAGEDTPKIAKIYTYHPFIWRTLVQQYLSEFNNCPYDDKLGSINELFLPTKDFTWGAGTYETKSSSGDYTLKYTISVEKFIKD